VTGFGRPGANKLSKIQGRGLIIFNARVTEFQSFLVDYDKPSEAGLAWLAAGHITSGKSRFALCWVEKLLLLPLLPPILARKWRFRAEVAPGFDGEIAHLHCNGRSAVQVSYLAMTFS
jgi:hypothetical protein